MKFQKKPVVIDAIQWKGSNEEEIALFLVGMQTPTNAVPVIYPGKPIIIPTLEGDHRADVNDWIIKGVKGEFYPCKPDIFEQTYRPA